MRGGDDVLVFYDRRRPRRSMIYAFEDDVIVGMELADDRLEAIEAEFTPGTEP